MMTETTDAKLNLKSMPNPAPNYTCNDTPNAANALLANERQAKLTARIKQLPNLPGVYKMLDKAGEVLYVGKAKSLKKRVSSYFVKQHSCAKTQALVMRIDDFELILTRGEVEALLLEQNLIKAHRPPYNVMLRDDKSYLYLYLSSDKYPRVAVGRGRGNHVAGRFFGPYPSGASAKEIKELVQKLFLIRSCSNGEFASRKRPCLEYQIKRCKAPCVGLVALDDYQADVAAALSFLKGDISSIQAALIDKMQAAAEDMAFEQAAMYRDRLSMLSDISARQAVYKTQGEADVMAQVSGAGVTCVHVLTVRGGQVLGGKNYFVDDVDMADDEAEKLARFVMSFYREVSEDVPSEIITSLPLPDCEAMAEVLSAGEKKVHIKHKVREHRREWLDIAKLNADNALAAQLQDHHELKARFEALKQVLASVSHRPIDRIECFDISHTLGEAAVGSCVVFDQGGARRRDYRHYAIYDIQAGDDYAAMRQVLTRRYQKQPLPDLLLIDGGKGQLNVAKEVLTELGKLEETLLVSVAKGEGRKAGLEVLHFLAHPPLDLPATDKALHLLMHIRDEAHRFAITHHRKKRDKARGASVLEVIPGLGAVRRRTLLSHFGGIGQLLGASEEEIAGVQGIGKTLAATIYKALHG